MSGHLSGNPSRHGAHEGNAKVSLGKLEDGAGSGWSYFSRKEIEENSPSRRHGIDLKKEINIRKSYCTFLQDFGMRLKVPQVTIATAITFCHRFFLRQSHAKNDGKTIATICMFLAGKVEETPRPLKDIILVSYEIIHKKDNAALQKIKQKDVYERQKELILRGERMVLATLNFDLNVHHPYQPLVAALKKFKVSQHSLAQVAWNFVNDGLRTSLCLQFMPRHISAGAIFLAAKFLKVKLPLEVLGQEFDITSAQLEEISCQMLELYEQNKVPPSQASDAEVGAGTRPQPQSKCHLKDEYVVGSSHGGSALKTASSNQDPSDNDKSIPNLSGLTNISDVGSCDISSIPNNREEEVMHNIKHRGSATDSRPAEEEVEEVADKHNGRSFSGTVGVSPQSASRKLDPEKLSFFKLVFERRKAQGGIARRRDPEDEIERELDKVEMPSQNDRSNEGRDSVEAPRDAGRRYTSPRSQKRAGKPRAQ